MRQPNITVYGSTTCPDTRRVTESLDRRQQAFEFKDVDQSPEYDAYIAGLNQGKRVMPTVQINNEVYFNPNMEVLEKSLEKAAEELKD